MKEGIIYTIAGGSTRDCLAELKRLLYNGSLTIVSHIRIPNNILLSFKKSFTRKKFLKKIHNILKKELGDSEIKIILDLRIEGQDFKEVAKTIVEYYNNINAITFSGALAPHLLSEIKESFPKLETILYSNLDDKEFFKNDIPKSSKIFYDLAIISGEFYDSRNLEKTTAPLCDFVVMPDFDEYNSKYNKFISDLLEKFRIGIIREKDNSWVIINSLE